MSGTDHGRRNIAAAPVHDLHCHLLPAYTHRVNCLGVTTSVLAKFLNMAFKRGGTSWPADSVSLATINQTHMSIPDG